MKTKSCRWILSCIVAAMVMILMNRDMRVNAAGIVSEELLDSAAADTKYNEPPEDWGDRYIGFKLDTNDGSRTVNGIYMYLYSSETVTAADTGPADHKWKLLIYGDAREAEIDLNSAAYQAMKARGLCYKKDLDDAYEGVTELKGVHLQDYFTYVDEIAVRNLDAFGYAAWFFGDFSSCEKVTFCEGTSSTGANETKNITSFPSFSFRELSELKTVVLPSCVTEIPYACFYKCAKLTAVPNADRLTNIGEFAFAECSSLTSANLSSASIIEANAFRNCNISDLTLKAGCNIGDSAFYNNSLTSVDDISKYTLGTGVFRNNNIKTISCNSMALDQFTGNPLESVTIKDDGKLFGFSSFKSTLKKVIAPDVTTVSDNTFSGCSMLTDVSLNSLTTVGKSAFYGCTGITQDKISLAGLTSIGTNAFYNTGITKVVLGSGITSWPNAFGGCKLTSITIPGLSEVPELRNFKDTLTTVVAENATSIVGRKSLTGSIIGAFEHCSLLDTVIIPNVKTIGEGTFLGCKKITQDNVDISQFTSIGENAFEETGVTEVVLNESITSWPDAFEGCKLTSVTIPGLSEVPELRAFKDTLTKVVAENATSIAFSISGAFRDCSLLDTVIIPNVKTIGKDTFYGCSKITQDNIDISQLTSIGDDAFWGTGITSVSLNSELKDFPDAFYGCDITYVNMPGAESIDRSEFYQIQSTLETVEAENVTSLSAEAFLSCTALTTLNLPSLKSIGERSFSDCTGLVSVSFGSAETIGTYAFERCSNLRMLNLDNVSEIYSYAFSGCPIEELSLKKILTIGEGAFSNCTQLRSVSIETATTISSSAFSECKNLESLSLRDVTNIGSSAFYGIGDDLSVKPVIAIPATQNIYIGNGAFKGNLAYATYDGTEDEWNERVSLEGDVWSVFGGAYIMFKDGTKIDPNEEIPAPTPGSADPDTPDVPTTIPDEPTPTPGPGYSDPSDIKEDPDAEYYSAVFYTCYNDVTRIYTKKNVMEGGSLTYVPEPEYNDYYFAGWYEVDSLTGVKPVRWYPGTPVYKDMVLSAVFVNSAGKTKIVIPDVEFPFNGEINIANLPDPVIVTPGDGSANNISNYAFNLLPAKAGFGDLGASGLDGYIDLGSITKNAGIYMVRGQKAFDSSVNIVSDDTKIIKVSKNGNMITAKKEGVTYLSITNKENGGTYKCKAVVVAPKMGSRKISLKAGKTENVSVVCGSYTSKYPIYWVSSNVDVAYVEASSTHGMAVVHGVGKGSAVITAYINGKAYKCKVKVAENTDASSHIPQIVHINKGQSKKLAPYKVPVRKAEWDSSDPDVASVENGKIRTYLAGATVITACYEDSVYRYYVFVEDPSLINTENLSGSGKRYSLGLNSGTLTYFSGTSMDQPLIFISKKPEIVFADENGFVIGRRAGVTDLNAKINKLSVKISASVF